MSAASAPRSAIKVEAVGTAVTLRAVGVIDRESADVWDRCISDVLDAGPTSVIMDLAEVSFLASAGLRLIVDLRQQLHVAGVPFALQHAPEHIGRVLELTGLIDGTAQP